MSDITIPPVVDGTVLDSSVVSTALYSPASLASFETINGGLDNLNRAAGWEVSMSQIQTGAVSGGRSVGATTNIDLFGDSFGNFTLTADQRAKYLPLPGASQTFYLPYDCSLVIFTWAVVLEADQTLNPQVRSRPFLNGTALSGVDEILFDPPNAATGKLARAWSGHHFQTSLLQGWHSFSLRVAGRSNVTVQTIRVRCRHLDYVYFK